MKNSKKNMVGKFQILCRLLLVAELQLGVNKMYEGLASVANRMAQQGWIPLEPLILRMTGHLITDEEAELIRISQSINDNLQKELGKEELNNLANKIQNND